VYAFDAVMRRLWALERNPLAGAVAVVRILVGAPEHNGKWVALRRHMLTLSIY
jgi:hypothetical protein